MNFCNGNNGFVHSNTAGNNCGCNNSCGCVDNCGCGNNGSFSCIINLIIILIVLEFLSNIICGLNCQIC